MEFAKNYFPDTYNDFDTASPGTMFIEMAAYVGDVLSFYTDYALNESMLHQATERKSVYDLAQAFGYKPKISVASTVDVDVFMKIPSTYTTTLLEAEGGENSKPDWDYALIVNEGMELKTDSGVNFRTLSPVNFAASSSMSKTELTVHTANAETGQPEWYLLKKSVKCVSGQQKVQTVSIPNVEKNKTILLDDENVIEIVSVVDAEGNKWYEVPFLAQDTIFEENVNSDFFDPTLYPDRTESPYILSLRKTSRRFITRVNKDNKLELQFGSGISSNSDVVIIPNSENVGSNLINTTNKLDQAFDPSNFMYTKTYGKAPDSNLTITYTVGKGLESNVSQKTLTTVVSKNTTATSDDTTADVLATVQASIAVSNPKPATGGKSQETVEEVRSNALAHFATQQRAVTREDYIVRALSMPGKFGSISKVFIAQDSQIDIKTREEVANPLALNLYVLGYDKNKNLTNLGNTTKENLRNYLSQYRMMTDAINIKNGYVINIGIDFSIVARPGRNSNEIVLRCVEALKNMYHIDNMQMFQPIIVRDIMLELVKIDGVQSVMDIQIRNKWRTSQGYSGNKYNLEEANKGGIIYPSKDPSIFEIKFPDLDIRGRTTTY